MEETEWWRDEGDTKSCVFANRHLCFCHSSPTCTTPAMPHCFASSLGVLSVPIAFSFPDHFRHEATYRPSPRGHPGRPGILHRPFRIRVTTEQRGGRPTKKPRTRKLGLLQPAASNRPVGLMAEHGELTRRLLDCDEGREGKRRGSGLAA